MVSSAWEIVIVIARGSVRYSSLMGCCCEGAKEIVTVGFMEFESTLMHVLLLVACITQMISIT